MIHFQVLPIFLASWIGLGEATSADTRLELEQLAKRLKFFSVHSFMANSSDRIVPKEMTEEYERLIAPLAAQKHDARTLIELLKHDNPKVRTLAAAGLFARLDPKLLPRLVTLASDPAETFPTPQLIARIQGDDSPTPFDKQTVGAVVTQMINAYLVPAGYHDGVDGNGNPGFDDYWSKRQHRAYCAGWFCVQLQWASGSIKKMRKPIDQVPEPDRTLILLWLRARAGTNVLATDEELLAGCKKLGPDLLLKLLQRKIPSDDPDLQARSGNNYQYAQMVMFVLEHSTQLLRPADADALLAYERWERDYVKHRISDPLLTAEWFSAAAELQPARAKEILALGWEKFQGDQGFNSHYRGRLALSQWRTVGAGEQAFVVKWFYDESQPRGFPSGRALFLSELGPKPQNADRKLVAALIADKRFDALDWQSLHALAERVNSWEKKPVIDREDLRSAWHPLGMGNFNLERAQKDYPRETAHLLQTLERWRKSLREACAIAGRDGS